MFSSSVNEVNLKDIIYNWAKSEPLVTKAYIFGSRATDNYRKDSDLDVVVAIKEILGEEAEATWICEAEMLRKRLAKKLVPYKLHDKLHLQYLYTSTVFAAVKKTGILVYEAPDEEATDENET